MIKKILILIILLISLVSCDNQDKQCISYINPESSYEGTFYKNECSTSESIYYGLVNDDYDLVIETKYSSIDDGTNKYSDLDYQYGFDSSIEYLRVSLFDKDLGLTYGVIDREGNEILSIEYEEVIIFHQVGLIYFSSSKTQYILDISSGYVTSFDFEFHELINSFYIMIKNNKEYIFDKYFNQVFDIGFNNVIWISSDEVIVELDNELKVFTYDFQLVKSLENLYDYYKYYGIPDNYLIYILNGEIIPFNYLKEVDLVLSNYNFLMFTDNYLIFLGENYRVFDFDMNELYKNSIILDILDNQIFLIAECNNYYLIKDNYKVLIGDSLTDFEYSSNLIVDSQFLVVEKLDKFLYYDEELQLVAESGDKCIIRNNSGKYEFEVLTYAECPIRQISENYRFVVVEDLYIEEKYVIVFSDEKVYILSNGGSVIFIEKSIYSVNYKYIP
ncbi:MAG: hypothetical protein KQ78_00401 [Candidatus Izimaplasma bacterium HR2]|nr:MAG: hypothetical protein KQ78_00401 [Candidatus Izimaplasma bacterium HR2]